MLLLGQTQREGVRNLLFFHKIHALSNRPFSLNYFYLFVLYQQLHSVILTWEPYIHIQLWHIKSEKIEGRVEGVLTISECLLMGRSFFF